MEVGPLANSKGPLYRGIAPAAPAVFAALMAKIVCYYTTCAYTQVFSLPSGQYWCTFFFCVLVSRVSRGALHHCIVVLSFTSITFITIYKLSLTKAVPLPLYKQNMVASNHPDFWPSVYKI